MHAFDEFQRSPNEEEKLATRIKGHHIYDFAATDWGWYVQDSSEEDLQHLAIKFLSTKEKLTRTVESIYSAE